jgi:peptidoglycan/xylan/chitin deacetylase (PgdA/CDA1 family)
MAKLKSKRILVVGCIVLVATVAGLLHLRDVADGFHNVFSIRYWIDRSTGRDLYDPSDRILKRGSRGHHELLLSFDDGPHFPSAISILDTLKREGVTATFFVVGRRVKEHPELVRRMISDGHQVGNHTQDHLRLDTLTKKQIDNEILNCATNFGRATGRRMTLLRPPGMRWNDLVLNETKALGYTIVGWNVGAKDFIPDQQITDMTSEESKSMRTTPRQVCDRVLAQVKDGAIILLHDNPVTASALPEMIEKLRAQGYEFDSATQFLAELPTPVQLVANPELSPKLALEYERRAKLPKALKPAGKG